MFKPLSSHFFKKVRDFDEEDDPETRVGLKENDSASSKGGKKLPERQSVSGDPKPKESDRESQSSIMPRSYSRAATTMTTKSVSMISSSAAGGATGKCVVSMGPLPKLPALAWQ